MKASEILRKAAEKIDATMDNWCEAGGCCAEIEMAFGLGEHKDAKRRAQQYIESLFENDLAYWFGLPFEGRNKIVNKDNQNHRIIALLLTADMAESVGD